MNWKCHQCQAAFEVPAGTIMQFCPQCGAKSAAIASSSVSPQASVQPESNVCPVCCTPIQPEDDKFVCPDCKMMYHKDCWNDNNGCATYGCHSAGCLNPPPLKVDVSGTNSSITGGEAPNTRGAGGVVCPKCHTQLASGTTFCWSCGNDVANVTKNSDDYLSTTGKVITWLSIMFLPFSIIVVGILYYSWRKRWPNKAAQLNKHSWIAFAVAIVLNIIIRLS